MQLPWDTSERIVREPLRRLRRGVSLAPHRFCGAMDGLADALISAATADVATHSIVDVSVGGVRFLREQGYRGHNLPRLAVAALRIVFLHPGFLDSMAAIRREVLDCSDLLSRYAGDGCDA